MTGCSGARRNQEGKLPRGKGQEQNRKDNSDLEGKIKWESKKQQIRDLRIQICIITLKDLANIQATIVTKILYKAVHIIT